MYRSWITFAHPLFFIFLHFFCIYFSCLREFTYLSLLFWVGNIGFILSCRVLGSYVICCSKLDRIVPRISLNFHFLTFYECKTLQKSLKSNLVCLKVHLLFWCTNFEVDIIEGSIGSFVASQNSSQWWTEASRAMYFQTVSLQNYSLN